VAQAPTDPERAETLAREVEAMYAHFAAEGPTPEELTVARRQLVAQLDEQLERPEFWVDWLSDLDYRARTPGEPAEARAQYERADGADVLAAFRRYWSPASYGNGTHNRPASLIGARIGRCLPRLAHGSVRLVLSVRCEVGGERLRIRRHRVSRRRLREPEQ
jgi:hypothetical protein